MLDYIRIACAVPPVKVGDTVKNTEDICRYIEKADGIRMNPIGFVLFLTEAYVLLHGKFHTIQSG